MDVKTKSKRRKHVSAADARWIRRVVASCEEHDASQQLLDWLTSARSSQVFRARARAISSVIDRLCASAIRRMRDRSMAFAE